MRRRFLLGTVAAMAATLVAGSALAAEIEIRYGLWAKVGEAQHLGVLKFKEVLEADSGGRIEVIIFPGNQLGTPREMLAQLALGTTQIVASGDPGIKEIEYLALPYLMKGIANYGAVLGSEIGDDWNKKLIEQRKVRFLGFFAAQPAPNQYQQANQHDGRSCGPKTTVAGAGLLCGVADGIGRKTNADGL